MSPQFVDFDRDGHVDILTATFDGSPWLARGGPDGFAAPEHLLDPDGERIRISEFWNYETERWDSDAGTAGDHTAWKGQCTSAVALDADGDGDLDLVLGDYKNGGLYLRVNEGTARKPAFPGKNRALEAGGTPIEIAGGVSTPRVVDWDGDGREDLIVGGFGDAHGSDPGGGVWWFRNVGRDGRLELAAGRVLIPPQEKGGTEPAGPDTALYPDAVDYDGDGDLDLVVGGYTHWRRPARELTADEEARVPELETEIAKLRERITELRRAALAPDEDRTKQETRAIIDRLKETPEYRELGARLRTARTALDILRPEDRRDPFVWLYRRVDAPKR